MGKFPLGFHKWQKRRGGGWQCAVCLAKQIRYLPPPPEGCPGPPAQEQGIRFLKSHCVRGHEFTPENTRIWHNGKRLARYCVQCHKLRNEKAYRNQAAQPGFREKVNARNRAWRAKQKGVK